jgi:hypothetical protein
MASLVINFNFYCHKIVNLILFSFSQVVNKQYSVVDGERNF